MRFLWPVWARPHRLRQYQRRLVAFTAVIVPLLVYLLPYDSRVKIALQYHLTGPLLRPALAIEPFMSEAAPFPADLSEDVAYILKTGYATQDRVAGCLQTLEDASVFRDLFLVADFAALARDDGSRFVRNGGLPLAVHDVVARTLARAPPALVRTSPRAAMHAKLSLAIEEGDGDAARALAKEVGYPLDAMKFISSLELAYRTAPDKKWYVLVDDDTYLVRPTLQQLLGQFDPAKPYYLGNAIGGWNYRFAHGGSAVVLSRGALQRLFTENPRAAAGAYAASLIHGWGDLLLAEALARVGVYVEEGWRSLFNGETPATTKIRPDRFCAPVVSFHEVKTEEAMRGVHGVFSNIAAPSRWIDVWALLGAPAWEAFEEEPLRRDWDHVGRTDEYTVTVEGVESALGCLGLCLRQKLKGDDACLAWTWVGEGGVCHLSPWIVVGERNAGRITGLNVQRVRSLAGACGA
ncbi:Uu.00g076460.m01.CDS01 [Anthostomella pinea]|uniref:N-acetylgalactosaminide beta-1,3-galactosyltransferase n=1 Tax=Anthostomella pinea TaxID=933095 RepID=A0AAI8YPC6_9PEZI|nr:Uu.00g076460.m01.CDS01 [Anthostomella pinea]